MTKVLFLINKGELFAYFPEGDYYHPGHDAYNVVFTCYAHVGQHSACHKDYAAEATEAIYSEYADLLRELIGHGYNDLLIMNDQHFEYHRKPTALELEQGYGATHYLSFTLSEIGITKQGKLKKWFVADNGLRYYR